MEARVAVLEEIARTMRDAMVRLEAGQDRLRADLQAGQDRLRVDLQAGQDRLRAELQGLRSDITAELRAIRTEVAAVRSEARADYRWLLGIMLGMAAGLLGVLARAFRLF